MKCSRQTAVALFALILVLMSSQPLRAADPENCLMCHRFRGLARVDKQGTYRLFYVDETLFNRGPHARVACTGCHADIEEIPHDNAKPVNCLRECHIEEPTREILFTHTKVETALKESVHAPMDANGVPHANLEDFPAVQGLPRHPSVPAHIDLQEDACRRLGACRQSLHPVPHG